MSYDRRRRVLALFAFLFCWLAAGCRSSAPDTLPPQARRTPIEKPWTRESIAPYTYLWVELSSGKHGLVIRPVLVTDEHGDYLTTKKDAGVHLLLSDVTVLEGVEIPRELLAHPEEDDAETAQNGGAEGAAVKSGGAEGAAVKSGDAEGAAGTAAAAEEPGDDAPVVQSVGTSLLAFWGGLIFFAPAILLIVLLG